MRLLERTTPLFRSVEVASRRILVANGHPDPRPARFCSAFCGAYEQGARAAGWTVRRLTVGSLASIVDSLTDSQALEAALEDIQWATQLIVVFPLWMDQMPPVLCDLFEENLARGNLDLGLAGEKSVRTVITMEFPALFQRALLQCGICAGGASHAIAVPGFYHMRQDFIGSGASIPAEQRGWWLANLREDGARAA
jgi:putative NADPH-quinone reductase